MSENFDQWFAREYSGKTVDLRTFRDDMRKAYERGSQAVPAVTLAEVHGVVESLMNLAWRNICPHENTHRGGVLWEICDDCGEKWADDEGGKPEWKDPKEITRAEEFLDRLQSQVAQDPATGAQADRLGDLLRTRHSVMLTHVSLVNLIRDAGLGVDGDTVVASISGAPEVMEPIHMQSLQEVLAHIAQERIRQDEKWGGPEHDDNHSPNEFVQLITDYAGWARVMAGMGNFQKHRKRMVQVAALAVAAVQATDRALGRAGRLHRENIDHGTRR